MVNEPAPSKEIDVLLHQPVRTRLAAFLATRGEATFTELKSVLEITDGNLDAHIKKLVSAGYLRARKSRDKGRPQTRYALSAAGKRAFRQYVQHLNALLNLEPDAGQAASGTSPGSLRLLHE